MFPSSLWLLWPLLTPRSELFSWPFRAQREASPGKTHGLPSTTAGSTSPSLGRKSFAVICPLALVGSASIRFLFVGLDVSLPASFSGGLAALPALRFAGGPCDQVPQRTYTSWSCFMLGTQIMRRGQGTAPWPRRPQRMFLGFISLERWPLSSWREFSLGGLPHPEALWRWRPPPIDLPPLRRRWCGGGSARGWAPP